MKTRPAVNLEPAEQEAHDFFVRLGLVVRPVQRTHRKTPEFEIDGDGDGYLVEVKARRDDDAVGRPWEDDTFHTSASENFSKGVLDNLKKAVRQLKEQDPEHRRLWIVWLTDETFISQGVGVSQIRGTLLGIKDVVEQKRGSATARTCYYAQMGAFEALPQIDMAIISKSDGFEPWLNEFGRPGVVEASLLGRLFRERGSLNVASEHATEGRSYIVSGGNQGRTEVHVQAYLTQRYGLTRPLVLSFQRRTAVGFVPH